MKLTSMVAAILLGNIALGSTVFSSLVVAQSPQETIKIAIEKGPNNGRMLRDGDFAIELAIFEQDVEPEFRVFATQGQRKILAQDVTIKVKLTRLGDVVDDINFFTENDYLRGDMVIYEPHSFVVTVTAKYAGKTHQWSYDNFEGRTTIVDEMADLMAITTELAQSQVLAQTLKVFGHLTLAPDASREIRARFPGEVKQLNAVLGQKVSKGQLLIKIESNDSLQSYQVLSPITGVVTKQSIRVGEQTGERPLLTITDASTLIAQLNVFPMDQEKVKVGALVTVKVAGSTKAFNTRIIDSLFAVNAQQAKIFRTEIDNSDGQLNVGQFVIAEISLASYQVPLAVKSTALQAFRDFTVVYAKVGAQYEVRMLELGRQAGPWVEVLGGLTQGTEYVVLNSYIIKADIEKSAASHDH